MPDKLTEETIKSFHEGEEKRVYVYVDGFGALFVGSARPKTGLTIGYQNKKLQSGNHDHVTVLYDAEGLQGLHRKVFGSEDYVSMTFNPAYFVTAKGLNKLFEDMRQEKGVSLIVKMVYVSVFQLANTAYTQGEKWTKDAKLLSPLEAQKRGMKSPCLYIKPSLLQRLFLFFLSRIIYTMVYYQKLMFGKEATKAFKEQHLPWVQVVKSKIVS